MFGLCQVTRRSSILANSSKPDGWTPSTSKVAVPDPDNPGRTKTRRIASMRPEPDWKVMLRPDLALVDAKLWDAVQRVRGKRAARFGTPQVHGKGKRKSTPSPLAGLVRCGICGGPMSLSGHINGGRSFVCSTRRSKGRHGRCPNNHTIQEARVLQHVGETARQALEAKKGSAAYLDFEAMLTASPLRQGSSGPNLAALDTAVRKAKAQAERIADVMLQVGVSDLLRKRFTAAEEAVTKAVADRAAADAVTQDNGWASRTTPELFRAYVRQVWENLELVLTERDSLKVGPWLREHLERVTVTPRETKAGTTWTLTLDVRLPEQLPAQKKAGSPRSRTAGSEQSLGCCGGGI